MPCGIMQWCLMLVRVPVGAVRIQSLLQIRVVGVQLQGLYLIPILQMLAELG